MCCESHFHLIFTCVASRHTLMALAGASRWQNMVQPLIVLTLAIFSISSCNIKRMVETQRKRRDVAKTAAAVPSMACRWWTDSWRRCYRCIYISSNTVIKREVDTYPVSKARLLSLFKRTDSTPKPERKWGQRQQTFH